MGKMAENQLNTGDRTTEAGASRASCNPVSHHSMVMGKDKATGNQLTTGDDTTEARASRVPCDPESHSSMVILDSQANPTPHPPLAMAKSADTAMADQCPMKQQSQLSLTLLNSSERLVSDMIETANTSPPLSPDPLSQTNGALQFGAVSCIDITGAGHGHSTTLDTPAKQSQESPHFLASTPSHPDARHVTDKTRGKRLHESTSSCDDTSLEHKRHHAGNVTPQDEVIEILDMDTNVVHSYTKVDSRNRSSHKEGSSVSDQKRAERRDGPTHRSEPEEFLMTYILFTAIRGFPRNKVEPFIKAFRGFIGSAQEVVYPGRHLGAMFRVPASKVGKAKSFTFAGLDLHAYVGEDKGLVYKQADLAGKGRTPNATRSFATLHIAADVSNAKLQDLFDFNLHKISDAKRVQIKGKDTDFVKMTFDLPAAPLQLKSRTADGIIYPLEPSFLQPIRCNKCQRFRHTAHVCKAKKPVCPHCAGNHAHFECKQKQNRKCANCGLTTHGAAYKGCISYINYSNELATKNRQIQANWDERRFAPKASANLKPEVSAWQNIKQADPVSQKQIVEAPLVYTAGEVIEIVDRKMSALVQALSKHNLLRTPVTPEVMQLITQDVTDTLANSAPTTQQPSTSTTNNTSTAITTSTDRHTENTNGFTQFAQPSTQGRKHARKHTDPRNTRQRSASSESGARRHFRSYSDYRNRDVTEEAIRNYSGALGGPTRK